MSPDIINEEKVSLQYAGKRDNRHGRLLRLLDDSQVPWGVLVGGSL